MPHYTCLIKMPFRLEFQHIKWVKNCENCFFFLLYDTKLVSKHTKELRGTYKGSGGAPMPAAPVPARAVPGVLAPQSGGGTYPMGQWEPLSGSPHWPRRDQWLGQYGHTVGCRGIASWDCRRLSMGCLGEESRVGKRRIETVWEGGSKWNRGTRG